MSNPAVIPDPTPPPPPPSTPASRAWAIDHVRYRILCSLNEGQGGLLKVLRTSERGLIERVGIAYAAMSEKRLEELLQRTADSGRYMLYSQAVRRLKVPRATFESPQLGRHLSQLPGLKEVVSACEGYHAVFERDGYGTIVNAVFTNSHTLRIADADASAPLPTLPKGFAKSWRVRRVLRLNLRSDPSATGPPVHLVDAWTAFGVILDAWEKEKGIFASAIACVSTDLYLASSHAIRLANVLHKQKIRLDNLQIRLVYRECDLDTVVIALKLLVKAARDVTVSFLEAMTSPSSIATNSVQRVAMCDLSGARSVTICNSPSAPGTVSPFFYYPSVSYGSAWPEWNEDGRETNVQRLDLWLHADSANQPASIPCLSRLAHDLLYTTGPQCRYSLLIPSTPIGPAPESVKADQQARVAQSVLLTCMLRSEIAIIIANVRNGRAPGWRKMSGTKGTIDRACKVKEEEVENKVNEAT